MSSGFARLRMKTQSECYWDIASGAVANDQLNFFTSAGRGNVLSLRSTGTPLVAYNGATLTDAGVWSSVSSVDRKTDFIELDKRQLLDQLSDMRVRQWRYKVEAETVRHVGPTSQDFFETFGLGESEEAIGMVDADGVALAAIQGLYELVKEQQAEIERLRDLVETR